jgi:hypothetical protein
MCIISINLVENFTIFYHPFDFSTWGIGEDRSERETCKRGYAVVRRAIKTQVKVGKGRQMCSMLTTEFINDRCYYHFCLQL